MKHKAVVVSDYPRLVFIVPEDYAARDSREPMAECEYVLTSDGTVHVVRGHNFRALGQPQELSLSDIVYMRLTGMLCGKAFDYITASLA